MTGLIKYIGIACNTNVKIRDRVIDHRQQDWYKQCDWRIEYFEVNNQSEAEAFESHLISFYQTDKWFNKSKAGWGINHYLPVDLKWENWDGRKKNNVDWTGHRFGKLTCLRRVADYVSPKGHHKTMWECKCDCGNIKIIDIGSIVSGRTKSCGCGIGESAKQRFTKHGRYAGAA